MFLYSICKWMKIDDKFAATHTWADWGHGFCIVEQSPVALAEANRPLVRPLPTFISYICHVIAISMSLTNESVSGDDKIESTWERCGDVASKLCVEPRIESAIQLLISICELLWWWWRWFCMLFDTWFDWFCDDNNGSQCWISMFESPFRPQFPFIPLWPMLLIVPTWSLMLLIKKRMINLDRYLFFLMLYTNNFLMWC